VKRNTEKNRKNREALFPRWIFLTTSEFVRKKREKGKRKGFGLTSPTCKEKEAGWGGKGEKKKKKGILRTAPLSVERALAE